MADLPGGRVPPVQQHPRRLGRGLVRVLPLVLLATLLSGGPVARAETPGVTSRESVADDGSQLAPPSADPSISGDGRYVAFEHRFVDVVRRGWWWTGLVPDAEVLLRDRATGTTEVVSLRPDGAPFADAHSPSISADGTKVAFVAALDRIASALEPSAYLEPLAYALADGTGPSDIVHEPGPRWFDPDAVTRTNVTGTPDVVEHSPALSPDGRRVAFVREVDGRSQVWIADVDGTDARQLTFMVGGDAELEADDVAAADVLDPAWSPDGGRIAVRVDGVFLYGAELQSLIVVVEVDVADAIGDVVNIPPSADDVDYPTGDRQPTWSPDGHQLAFVGYREEGEAGGVDDLRIVDVTSGGVPFGTGVATTAGFTPEHPDWASDGSFVIGGGATPATRGLHRVVLIGGEFPTILVSPLTGEDAEGTVEAHPSLSDDGRAAAFARSGAGGPQHLWQLDPLGDPPEATMERRTPLGPTQVATDPDLGRWQRAEDNPAGISVRIPTSEGQPAPTGTVSFWLCVADDVGGADTAPCATGGELIAAGPPVPVVDGRADAPRVRDIPGLQALEPNGNGPYCWRAAYSGDDRYLPAQIEDQDAGCFQPTRTITSVQAMRGETDGGAPQLGLAFPTGVRGWVTFHLCGPAEVDGDGCADGGRYVSAEPIIPGATTTANSPGTAVSSEFRLAPPTEPGRYCWRAEYGGDAARQARTITGTGNDLCFSYDPIEEDTNNSFASITADLVAAGEVAASGTTQVSALPSISLRDGTEDPPGGRVEWVLCGPAESTATGCPTGGEVVGTTPTTGGEELTGPEVAIGDPGYHCWRVEYRSDESWFDVAHTAGDLCRLVRPATTSSAGEAPEAVWLRDRAAGTTTLVSVNLDGGMPTGDSTQPALSPDGTHVAFTTRAADVVDDPLVDDDRTHVVLRDLVNGSTELVSVLRECDPEELGWCYPYGSSQPTVSAGGAVVAFTSSAMDLDAVRPLDGSPFVPGWGSHVYRRDMALGRTTVESLRISGEAAYAAAESPSLSHDGRHLAFASADPVDPAHPEVPSPPGWSEITAAEQARAAAAEEGSDGEVGAASSRSLTWDWTQIYVRDLTTGLARLVSLDAAGQPAMGASFYPAISGDGRTVAFSSNAPGLAPDDPAGLCEDVAYEAEELCEEAQVFVTDLVRRTTGRVSVDSEGRTSDNFGSPEDRAAHLRPAISTNGRYVAFDSNAADLVDGDTNAERDVFVRDRTPRLLIAPDPLTFAGTVVGGLSAPATLTVTNTGSGPAVIDGVTLTAGDVGDFPLTGADTCTGQTLHRGEVCTVGVRFSPTAAGDRTATVVVGSDDPAAPAAAVLRGRGLVPGAALTPDPVDFGSVVLGTTSEPRIATLASTGDAPLAVTAVTVTGPHAADFAVAAGGTCQGATVAAGGACAVLLRFTPAADGVRQADLRIATAAGERTVRLRGAGRLAPAAGGLALTPDPVDFGTVPIGVPSGVRLVTGLSTGPSGIEITGVEIEGGSGAFTTHSGSTTCAAGTVLDAGQACAVGLRFTPGAVGAADGVLRVRLAGGQSRTVRLQGAGGPRVLEVPDLDFGVVPPGERSEPLRATLRNTGTSTVDIATVALGGEDAESIEVVADTCTGAALAAAATCAIDLVLAPTAPGRPTADLVVRSSAQTAPQLGALRGLAPGVEPDPALGPPGFVTEVRGTFFPPDTNLLLEWDPGLGGVAVRTNGEGSFTTPMLVLRRDRLGPREVVAVGDGYEVRADFLVVPGSAQPGDFRQRR